MLIVDGHVHITNRVYWEEIDPWIPQAQGFDYARAAQSGVGVVVENVAPYGFSSYNQTPRQTLRLIETFHRVVDANKHRMGLALSADHAREIVASGRLAVFLGVEAGFDHEGDIDVLRAFYRLGVRSIQFSTQSCFNACGDISDGGDIEHWGGLSPHGRKLLHEMNRLGVLVDITHASRATMEQIIEASDAPVTASHLHCAAVSGGDGLDDELIRKLAARGGMVGIHGAAARVGVAYREWISKNPDAFTAKAERLNRMVRYRPHAPRSADDSNYGMFGRLIDKEFRALHTDVFQEWTDDPEAQRHIPTPAQWAEHARHIIDLVGPSHVGIGLDLFGSRSSVIRNASGYPELLKALDSIADPTALALVAGENWLNLLDRVQGQALPQ